MGGGVIVRSDTVTLEPGRLRARASSTWDGARERLGPDSLSAIAEDTRSIRGVASDTDPSSGATLPVGHPGGR